MESPVVHEIEGSAWLVCAIFVHICKFVDFHIHNKSLCTEGRKYATTQHTIHRTLLVMGLLQTVELQVIAGHCVLVGLAMLKVLPGPTLSVTESKSRPRLAKPWTKFLNSGGCVDQIKGVRPL